MTFLANEYIQILLLTLFASKYHFHQSVEVIRIQYDMFGQPGNNRNFENRLSSF
jgi:hypothetical protein